MAKKNKTQDPYKMELLDLWNEVGGQMVIKYHIATIKPDKGDLQQLRDKGFKTDVMAYNPMVNQLVEAIENQEQEREP